MSAEKPGGLLAGRTVLITGASGGVGAGMARACATAGANVVIAARRLPVAEKIAEQLGPLGGDGLAVSCDVTRRSDVISAVNTTVDRFGGLDAFIHNAVADNGVQGPIENVPDDIWNAQMAVALTASYYSAHAAFPHLRESGGSFVLLISGAGILGSGNIPAYATVKAGLRGLAKSLAREWGPYGVRVNCIGPVALTAALEHAFRTTPSVKDRVINSTPLRRVGDPDDIGGAAVFLISDLGRFVSGQTLMVDGGYSTML